MNMLRTFKPLFALAVALQLAACSSLDPMAAAKLAERGVAVSSGMSDLYAERADSLERYLEGECVLAAMKKGYSIPSRKMVDSVDSVEREMLLRREMFAKLAETYRAFGRLALYDDAGMIVSSIRGLADAVNDYTTVSGGEWRISPSETDFAALVGRSFFSAYHKSRIAKASAMIRRELEAMSTLLRKRSEKDAVLAMEREVDRVKLNLALALWNSGMALPTGIIHEHIEAYGLEPNETVTMRQIDRMSTGKMKTAVANILKFRHRRETRGRARAYASSIKALESLIDAHKSLERGAPVSFEAISEQMRTLREYSRLLSEINATSHSNMQEE